MQFNTSSPFAAKKTILWLLVLIILVLGNLFLWVGYVASAKELKRLQQETSMYRVNTQVVNFLTLFIDKVLKTDKEVPFEDRLQLENAVRNINDQNILAKWEQFTGASTQDEIQEAVKNLLEALVKKISL